MRVSIARTSVCVPTISRLVIGSTTTTSGRKLFHGAVHGDQVGFQAEARGPVRVELELSAVDPGLQVDAGRRACCAPSAAATPRRGSTGTARPRRQAASAKCAARLVLPGAGGARDQHRAAAVVPAAGQHLVELGQAARDAVRRGARAAGCSEVTGSTREAVVVDQERVLVGAVVGAAVLDDADPARRNLIVDAVIELDHRVGDVFLEAVARERALAAFAGNHDREVAIAQPAEQPAQLRAEDRLVLQAGEQRLDGVQDDALGAHRRDGVIEADEEALEVVLTGLLDLAAVDVDVVDDQPLPLDQGRPGRSRARRRPGRAPRRSPRSSSGRRVRRRCSAPLTRKLMPSRVLPEPGPPQTSVGRPAGRPPWVISSRPGMPVGALRRAGREGLLTLIEGSWG